MKSISIKKAVIINFISKYSNIIIQILINSILARLLTPNDYGIVAIINVFVSFFYILCDLGIGPAIIQNKELDEEDIISIFSYTKIIAIVTAIVFIIFSFPLSYFYENKVYIKLGAILSINIIFSVLNMVPNSLMLKEKRFKEIAVRTIVITLLGGVITIILALLNFKYYAIVINSVVVSFATFIWNYNSVKLKNKFSLNRNSLNKIKSFASFQFGFNIINYFSRNLDNILIGKIWGNSALGYYDKAYKLMLYPIQNLTNVITPVLHPILSEYENKEKIYSKYVDVVKLLSLIGVFISVFCFFSSKEIITIIFGKKWVKSILSFKILSVSIIVQMTSSSSGTIFQATNETKKMFFVGCINSIINIAVIIMGILGKRIEFVALGIAIGFYINFFIAYYILIKKVFNKGMFEFLKNFLSSICIGILCVISLYFFNMNIDNILISLIYKFTICFMSYIVGLLITKEYKFFMKVLNKK